MRVVDELAHSFMRHGKAKSHMGKCVERELKTAAELWEETLQFYQESYGNTPDNVNSTISPSYVTFNLQVYRRSLPLEL